MRKQLYLDIKTILKNIKDNNGLPLIRHYDLWNQNVEFIEQDSPFLRPAVFVEFLPHPWDTIMNRVQTATITIRLHIVTDCYAQTADYSPGETQALDYLDLPDKIFAAMQSNAASNSNGFMRTNSIPNHNHETIIDQVEEYTTLINDLSAVPAQKAVNVTPVITNNDHQ